MEQFSDWLNSISYDIWYRIIAIIVVILLLYLLRKVLGFFLTLFFVILAILAGILIFNEDLFFQFYDQVEQKQNVIPKEKMHSFKKHLKEKYDSIKPNNDTQKENGQKKHKNRK